MKLVRYTTIMVLGFLIGSTVGEILYLLLPENSSTLATLAKSCASGFSPVTLNLRVINISLGIEILVNGLSWIGLFISAIVLLVREIAGM
ncbi:MAG: DUF4321 domain-containing protein [Candidatus Omnitrophica bacterium]|nr:DUF4321 domain-containing protein [Candidatus Omnitrophota bacterium]